MKKSIILFTLILSSGLTMAEDLAPTSLKIIAQDKNVAWVKFRDNSDGDFFRFYFDGEANSRVIRDKADTKERNGKSRVMRLKVNQLTPNKIYKMTVGVIKENKKVAESKPIALRIGELLSSDQAPKVLKVFKATQRYTWVKFRDNSDGDFFRFYFNGKPNQEAIKDFKDTIDKNGKTRMRAINITKLAPNSKFEVTIGVIKNGKKIAESEPFTIETGNAVDLTQKVIDYNVEHGVSGNNFQWNVHVDFYLKEHLAVIYGAFQGPEYINIYRIDDNNNVRYLDDFDHIMYNPESHEYTRMDHQYYSFEPYDNESKLKISLDRPEEQEIHHFDVSDLDNIIQID